MHEYHQSDKPRFGGAGGKLHQFPLVYCDGEVYEEDIRGYGTKRHLWRVSPVPLSIVIRYRVFQRKRELRMTSWWMLLTWWRRRRKLYESSPWKRVSALEGSRL